MAPASSWWTVSPTIVAEAPCTVRSATAGAGTWSSGSPADLGDGTTAVVAGDGGTPWGATVARWHQCPYLYCAGSDISVGTRRNVLACLAVVVSDGPVDSGKEGQER
jgi:hypothetical protein